MTILMHTDTVLEGFKKDEREFVTEILAAFEMLDILYESMIQLPNNLPQGWSYILEDTLNEARGRLGVAIESMAEDKDLVGAYITGKETK